MPRIVHPDLTTDAEDREQTAAKLEVMRRYWGAWGTILAKANVAGRGYPFCNRELWMIDCMAGAGAYPSRETPGGYRLGSAFLAVRAARDVQRKYPRVVVRVVAIDIDSDMVALLHSRLDRFDGEPPDGVRLTIRQGDFASVMPQIEKEIDDAPDHVHPNPRYLGKPHQHRSLWLIDPYGYEAIPHEALSPLGRQGFGSEVIINLDTAGVWRQAGRQSRAAAATLSATFGGEYWEPIVKAGEDLDAAREAIADAYARSFPAFEFQRAHRLRATSNQVRFLVHLTHVRDADTAFTKSFEAGMNAGTPWSTAMTEPQIAQWVDELRELFRGESIAVNRMVSALPLRGTQVRTICNEAVRRGYGDLQGGMMTWFDEPQQVTLGLLDS